MNSHIYIQFILFQTHEFFLLFAANSKKNLITDFRDGSNHIKDRDRKYVIDLCHYSDGFCISNALGSAASGQTFIGIYLKVIIML